MKSPKISNDLNYNKSVTKMRVLIVNWKNISAEILQEYHITKKQTFYHKVLDTT
jgi:hypothetical protein